MKIIKKFKKYRNTLRLTLRAAKKNYFRLQFERHAHNPKLLWSTLLESINKSKQKSELPAQFQIGNELVGDPVKVAQEFNMYYSKVGPNIDESLGPSSIDPLSYMHDAEGPEMMSFNPVSHGYVHKTICNLKDVGAGLDGISAKLLKLLAPAITVQLTYLFNLCLTKHTFPRIFKRALITPIYKSGSRTLFSNYRPISILPILSKVLESIIYDQLFYFIHSKNILFDYQFGFRPNHSTYMPVSLLHDFITANLSDRRKVAGIYVDLAKAFDTVNTDILSKKIEKTGITNNAHKLLQSYLSSRTQQLKYNGIISGPTPMRCGVPQGSVLGPLLFLLYINDLNSACNDTTMFLFADDTVLLYSAENSMSLQSMIVQSLSKVARWLHANRLSLAIPKTFYQLYSCHDPEKDMQISIGHSVLKRAKTVKYLGVLIDEDLKFKSHVNKVSGLCSRNIGVVCRSKHLLTKKLLVLLYNALILPHLTYCCVIWGCNYDSVIKPVITAQKRAIRIISGVGPREHTSPLFKEIGTLKFTDLVRYHTLLIIHDYLFQHLPNPLNKFRLCNNTRPTRSIQHFEESVLTSIGTAAANYRVMNYRKRVLFYNGPRVWNSVIAQRIPDILDIPASKSLFKKCVKIIFSDQY